MFEEYLLFLRRCLYRDLSVEYNKIKIQGISYEQMILTILREGTPMDHAIYFGFLVNELRGSYYKYKILNKVPEISQYFKYEVNLLIQLSIFLRSINNLNYILYLEPYLNSSFDSSLGSSLNIPCLNYGLNYGTSYNIPCTIPIKRRLFVYYNTFCNDYYMIKNIIKNIIN